MSRALRDINVGIAIMCGVASGYYIFDPVVRAAGEEHKQKKAEEIEIAQVVREPLPYVQAQLAGAQAGKTFTSSGGNGRKSSA